MGVREDVGRFVAGDLTNEERKVLRKALYRVGERVVLAVFITFCFGGLAVIGIPGFLRATELDNKIRAAVNPIKADVSSIKQAMADQSKKLDTLANAATAQTLQTLRIQIVQAKEKQCKSPKAETAAIYRAQVFAAQEQYFQLTQQNYPAPTCADL